MGSSTLTQAPNLSFGSPHDRALLDPENDLIQRLEIIALVEDLETDEYENVLPEAKRTVISLAKRAAPAVAGDTYLRMVAYAWDDGSVELILDHKSTLKRVTYIVAPEGNLVRTLFSGHQEANRLCRPDFASVREDVQWAMAKSS